MTATRQPTFAGLSITTRGGDAEIGRARAGGGGVELAELIVGGGEADAEFSDFAEPAHPTSLPNTPGPGQPDIETSSQRSNRSTTHAPNVQAGEDVRIIPVRDGRWPDDVPAGDFWFIDSRRRIRHVGTGGHCQRREST